MPNNPSKPVPNNMRLAGSGTAVTSASSYKTVPFPSAYKTKLALTVLAGAALVVTLFKVQSSHAPV